MNCRVCGADVGAGGPVLPDMCSTCTKKAADIATGGSGLGDKVAGVTKALGIKQKPGCGCRDRQIALNNVDLNGPKLAVAKALLQAIVNPKGEKQ